MFGVGQATSGSNVDGVGQAPNTPQGPDPAANITPQQWLGGQQGQPQTDPHGFTVGWHGTVPGGDVEADDSCRERKR